MNRTKRTVVVLALCSTLVILLFLLATPHTKALIDWVALGFLLLGIFLVTILLAQKGGTLFANLALGSVSGIYLCANLVMTLLARPFFQAQILRFVGLQLAVLTLAAAICMALILFMNTHAVNQKN